MYSIACKDSNKLVLQSHTIKKKNQSFEFYSFIEMAEPVHKNDLNESATC